MIQSQQFPLCSDGKVKCPFAARQSATSTPLPGCAAVGDSLEIGANSAGGSRLHSPNATTSDMSKHGLSCWGDSASH